MSQVQIYLKLKLKQNGLITGPATATGHAGDLLIDSFKWSESLEGSPAAGARIGAGGSLSVKDFEFTMAMSRASPLIMLGSLMMDPVLQATVACHHENSKDAGDFVVWTLKTGIITSYETVCTSEFIAPRDRFTIRFRSVGVDFRALAEDGSLGTTFSTQFDLGTMSSGGSSSSSGGASAGGSSPSSPSSPGSSSGAASPAS